ncbi:MAG: hypothetical protein KAW12_12265 [Candidatus Aminicenantes bacterium]|nr:hypothetical protein [Candidatus Aminicenantes bacterium]
MKDLRLIVIVILVIFCFLFFVNCKTTGNGDDNGNDNGNGDDNGTPDTEAIIVDHTCTDLSQIPTEWIDKVKEQLNLHYAHTSHGEQIIIGLERLAQANAVYSLEVEKKSTPLSSKYNFWYENCNIPSSTNHLTMMDGQYYDDYCETYVSPDLYWESDYGMTITRSVLNSFNVNVSFWAWCSQQDYYSQAETQRYLDRMSQLETEFPDVTFIYMTGNAQSADQNRLDRNDQVRNYCRENKKILFDFADLDCWYNGEQHKEDGIPTEHPHYNGDQAGHTTFASCENKGKASWWLLARIAGWVPGGDSL